MILNNHIRITFLTILIVIVMISMLSACGKKGQVQPPQGEKTDFPRKYPSY